MKESDPKPEESEVTEEVAKQPSLVLRVFDMVVEFVFNLMGVHPSMVSALKGVLFGINPSDAVEDTPLQRKKKLAENIRMSLEDGYINDTVPVFSVSLYAVC